ncbi:hypothetical protein STEG23_024191 [Scotinomys teguina]
MKNCWQWQQFAASDKSVRPLVPVVFYCVTSYPQTLNLQNGPGILFSPLPWNLYIRKYQKLTKMNHLEAKDASKDKNSYGTCREPQVILYPSVVFDAVED